MYLLDANVFIDAMNRYYRISFCPGFWKWIILQRASRKMYSIDKVYNEIAKRDDDLSNWINQELGKDFFVLSAHEFSESAKLLTAWANSSNYQHNAIAGFLGSTDFFLIAQAISTQHVVVTLELSSNSRKKIKIPDACRELGVKCIDTFDLLEVEQAHFILNAEG